MEFYHLRSFVLVAKTGNLTAAAKQLYTTPPAISAHIKNLEEELKTDLFIRSSKGMSLTGQGKLLLSKAEATLNSAIDMVNLAAENQNTIIGDFKLSINQQASQLKVTNLHQNIIENCEGINLHIFANSTGKAIEEIKNKSIDGGYIYGKVPEYFSAIKIKKQNITTITPYSSKLNSNTTRAELTNQAWIQMGAYCPFDQALKSKLPNHQLAKINTNDDDTRLSLVKSGCGVSLLETEVALQAALNKQVNILQQLDFTIDLYFVVLKERQNEPVIKAMIEEIKILWNIKS